MQTVSQAIELVSYVTGTERGRVNQLARALLNEGILPKSTGRDVKKIDAAQLLPLVAAVALADKVADAAHVARQFMALPIRMSDDADQPEDGRYLPYFFKKAMDPKGVWKSTAIEFSRAASGFMATLDTTIVSEQHEITIQIPFWSSPSWGHFCKSSFTISAEGVEVMRNLFARDDIEGMSFALSTGTKAR